MLDTQNTQNLVELKEKVQEKLVELNKKAYMFAKVDVNPKVTYNLAKSRTLGTYEKVSNTIDLNPDLLLGFGEEYIEKVLIHEFCHAVVYHIDINLWNKIKPHGKEFVGHLEFLVQQQLDFRIHIK